MLPAVLVRCAALRLRSRATVFVAFIAVAVVCLPRSSEAQVVQLPTFEYFSAPFSVLVPDSGASGVAGFSGKVGSRQRSGLPGGGRVAGNNAIDDRVLAGGAGVAAQIHDMAELDRRVLAEADRRRGEDSPRDAKRIASSSGSSSVSETRRRRLATTRESGQSTSSAEQGAESLAEIRAKRAATIASEPSDAECYFAKAEAAADEGKPAVATMYYQMAARRGDDALRAKVAARLAIASTAKP